MKKTKLPKLYIGPMSKNVVDATIDLAACGWNICFMPSRRQIDYDEGYVNNWTTSEFVGYLKSRTDRVWIQRDHAGPNQGRIDDDGLEALSDDRTNRYRLTASLFLAVGWSLVGRVRVVGGVNVWLWLENKSCFAKCFVGLSL